MKNIFKLLMATIMSFLVVGCGSETIVQSDITVLSKKSTLSSGNKSLKMDLVLSNNYASDVQVEIKDLRLNVSPCVIESSSITPSNVTFGSARNIEVTAQLFFKNSCTPTAYKLDGTTVLTLDGKSREIPLVSSLEELNQASLTDGNNTNVDGATHVNNEISYRFKNPTPIVVTGASETKTISIDLIDTLGVGVSGKEVLMTTLESKFGSISSSRVTTDASGKASFSYTAPSNFDAVNNQTATVDVIYAEESNYIKKEITINFKKDNNSDNKDADTVLPIVVIENSLKTIELTSNSKSIAITMQVFKDSVPYSSGTVKVELPSKVLNGVDVGIFEAYEVPVDSRGIATFNYTGPANLKALMDNNDLSTVFKFYHTENSASETRQAVTVTYNLDEDSYVPINYVLEVTTPNNDFSMGIPNISKTFSVVLKDLKGQIINNDDIDISKIEVSTENALIAQIIHTTTGVTTNTLLLKNENNSAFTLVTNKLSGIVPLRINIEFKDINNELKKLSTIVNVRVMSGPPSAISISYVSSTQDTTRAKYEEIFAITVTDEYANKVNTNPYISLGAIIGYAVDGQEVSSIESNNTKRLYYAKRDIENSRANGEIVTLGDEANSTNFEDNTAIRSEVFKWVNAEGNNTDKLVIFGKGKNYEAMGKWDFTKINNNTLSLQDDYFGEDRTDLYYAVGHNYYQDQCLDDGREWLGSTDSETYQLDDEGTVRISYKYDYNLMGKDALIWVNLNGYQSDTAKNTRIGEVLKHTLRGKGLTKFPLAGYSLDKNETSPVIFKIYHNAINQRYRNARFTYDVKEGSSCNIIGIQSSNDYDARTCNNGKYSDGTAYVTFLLKADEDKGCTFDITRLRFLPEF